MQGIFPTPNLGSYGTERDRHYKIISNLGSEENPKKSNENYGKPNWEINLTIDSFNKHTGDFFDLGMVIVPDEMIFWIYIHIYSSIKIVGRNTRSTGLGLKYLSDTVTNIITMINLVKNKKVMYAKEYVK